MFATSHLTPLHVTNVLVCLSACLALILLVQHMFAFLFLLFVLYAGVSTTIMKFFKCTEIEGIWLLDADHRLQCFEPEW